MNVLRKIKTFQEGGEGVAVKGELFSLRTKARMSQEAWHDLSVLVREYRELNPEQRAEAARVLPAVSKTSRASFSTPQMAAKGFDPGIPGKAMSRGVSDFFKLVLTLGIGFAVLVLLGLKMAFFG